MTPYEKNLMKGFEVPQPTKEATHAYLLTQIKRRQQCHSKILIPWRVQRVRLHMADTPERDGLNVASHIIGMAKKQFK